MATDPGTTQNTINWLTVVLSLASGIAAALITSLGNWFIYKKDLKERYRVLLLPEKTQAYKRIQDNITKLYPISATTADSFDPNKIADYVNLFSAGILKSLHDEALFIPRNIGEHISEQIEGYRSELLASTNETPENLFNKFTKSSARLTGYISRVLIDDLGVNVLANKPRLND